MIWSSLKCPIRPMRLQSGWLMHRLQRSPQSRARLPGKGTALPHVAGFGETASLPTPFFNFVSFSVSLVTFVASASVATVDRPYQVGSDNVQHPAQAEHGAVPPSLL